MLATQNNGYSEQQVIAHLRESFKFTNKLLPYQQRASVALIIRPERSNENSTWSQNRRAPNLEVLLIQRAPRAGDPWSAHLAFPGGHRDSGDADDISTARRETFEELGVELSAERYPFVTRLNDRVIHRVGSSSSRRHKTKSALCAFVFWQSLKARDDEFTLQPEEVASAFWVSLDHLHLGCSSLCDHVVKVRKSAKTFWLTTLRFPAVDVLPIAKEITTAESEIRAPHKVLWGLTLSIVGDFVTMLGYNRIDFGPPLPENRVLAAFLSIIAYILFRMKQFLQ